LKEVFEAAVRAGLVETGAEVEAEAEAEVGVPELAGAAQGVG